MVGMVDGMENRLTVASPNDQIGFWNVWVKISENTID